MRKGIEQIKRGDVFTARHGRGADEQCESADCLCQTWATAVEDARAAYRTSYITVPVDLGDGKILSFGAPKGGANIITA